jgi:hypothetical protein
MHIKRGWQKVCHSRKHKRIKVLSRYLNKGDTCTCIAKLMQFYMCMYIIMYSMHPLYAKTRHICFHPNLASKQALDKHTHRQKSELIKIFKLFFRTVTFTDDHGEKVVSPESKKSCKNS